MKPKTLILMVVAIGCGLVASYMTSRVIADRSDKPSEEKVTVLVARQNITMGTWVKDAEKLFEEKQFTKGEEPKKAIRSFDDVRGKRLNKPLSEEQFVTPDDLATKEQEGLAALMQPGMRALALKVDAAAQVGGFVQSHSRVDIVSVVKRNENETYSKIILQNILVLAVDQTSIRPEDKQAFVANTVTVQVTPQQAEVLSLAMELGTLKLIMRAYGDEEKVATAGVTPKGVARSGSDRGEEQPVNFDDGSRKGSTFGLGKIPDVPKATRPQGNDGGIGEPPQLPRTHTLTIYNGDSVTRAVFTLADKDGPGETKIEKGPAPTPVPKPTGKGSSVK